MLQALRSKVGSWVVKILFVLLIASFGVWGVGDVFRGQVSTTVAEVGDAEIST
ncbi:MAG TPA: SurA N-terminal domain-containing protein, partial [Arenibaculum sp.]|nr:SurA N-terminal domain-containing protein [Arenibaculum sp.]